MGVSPDGTRYYFDRMVTLPATNIRQQELTKTTERILVTPSSPACRGNTLVNPPPPSPDGGGSGRCISGSLVTNYSTTVRLQRSKVAILASRVVDRFGNEVRYDYDDSSRLMRIRASDGRQLLVSYSAANAESTFAVSDGSRTWTYAPRALGLTVTQPDGLSFDYSLSGQITDLTVWPFDTARSCVELPIANTQVLNLTATHPSGLRGEYSFSPKLHGKANVEYHCDLTSTSTETLADPTLWYPLIVPAMGLDSRRLSGIGVAPQVWTYRFGPSTPTFRNPPGEFALNACTPGGCQRERWMEIEAPDGTVTRNVFGMEFESTEGRLLSSEVSRGGVVIRRSVQRYMSDAELVGQPFAADVGLSPQPRSARSMAQSVRPQVEQETVLDGRVFRKAAAFCGGRQCFDRHARALATVEGRAPLDQTKLTETEYYDDVSLWVLGQIQRRREDGVEASRVEFNGFAQPVRQFSFGQLQSSAGYHGDGTVAWVADAKGQATFFNSWFRGIPRSISYPDGTTQSATVSPEGWLTSITDQNGFTTSYGYDAMGRLSGVNYPNGDSVAPTPTIMTLVRINEQQHGSIGHWRRSTYRGNQHTNIYLDALFRPIMEERLDVSDIGNTLTQVVKQYDALGRLTFESYPQRGIQSGFSGSYHGTRTEYDALGRVTKATQDSELGPLVTRTEYLPGFQTRTTNPKGQQTTTSYLTFGSPSTDWPQSIHQPEGRITEIFRDVFGKPTTIRRRSADGSVQLDRTYVYDAHQRLCKQIDPETGASVYDYDAAGNVAWRVTGSPLTANHWCDRGNQPAGDVIRFSYDAMNRVVLEDRPGADVDIATAYTPDGLVRTLSAGDYHWHYDYNRLRLPTRERIEHIFQGMVFPYEIYWRYDAMGHRSGMVINSTDVDYAPNALGQPTRVGPYATGALYHPNGALKSVTLGNGVTRTFTQNVRGMLERTRDASWQVVMDETVRYDANGNPVDLIDHVWAAPGAKRDMQYDGLDRLTYSHVHGLHIENYQYDVLDNIRRRDFFNGATTRTDTYAYDALNRLQSISSSPGGVQTFGYGPRGNMAQRLNLTHTFNSANQLVSLSSGHRFEYDGYGRRTVSWWPGGGGKMDVYDAGGVLRYTSDMRYSGGFIYLHLGGTLIGERFARWDGTGEEVKYVHTDGLGSPVVRTDRWGSVIERERFMAFGQPTDGSVRETLGFTGHMEDPSLGLTYMQQRYYDPTIGRFLSVDPVGPLEDPLKHFGRYHYVSNNPYKYIDPDGRSEEAWAQLGETIGVEISKYQYRNSTDPQQRIRLGNHLALVHSIKYGDQRTAQQYRLEVQQLQGSPAGVIYRRIDPKTGETYIGQAKSPERFTARQAEHDRELGVRHDYEVLGRAEPGRALDVAEETQIRLHGGLKQEGGGVVNRRHQMSEGRYRGAGGQQPPTGTRIRRR